MARKLRTIEMERLTLEVFHQAEKMPLTVVLDDVRSMHNMGSVQRTVDAFREEVVLCGITGTPPHLKIHKTALGAEDSVAWLHCPTILEAVQALYPFNLRIRKRSNCSRYLLNSAEPLYYFKINQQ